VLERFVEGARGEAAVPEVWVPAPAVGLKKRLLLRAAVGLAPVGT
jgi:hypothetical protein